MHIGHNDCGQPLAIINKGAADELRMERIRSVGVTITTPNGESIFLTDGMLLKMVNFEALCRLKEFQEAFLGITK
jgi:hypothetical protein